MYSFLTKQKSKLLFDLEFRPKLQFCKLAKRLVQKLFSKCQIFSLDCSSMQYHVHVRFHVISFQSTAQSHSKKVLLQTNFIKQNMIFGLIGQFAVHEYNNNFEYHLVQIDIRAKSSIHLYFSRYIEIFFVDSW